MWDEDGRPVGPDVAGEVVLRGPKVFRGYWRYQEATDTAFAGGWFHTGDLGVRDADGYLYIVDRLKDMIVSGGENIAGSEVERVLYEHTAVLEAAVVGRSDDRWGEVPVAFVVLRQDGSATAEELVEHCGAQLARFKVPKDILFLDALPLLYAAMAVIGFGLGLGQPITLAWVGGRGRSEGPPLAAGWFEPGPARLSTTMASSSARMPVIAQSGTPLNLLTWSAPVSNDAVTLEFSQLVKDTDPLRTGTYSKSLTFTLSTTTP